MLHSSPVMAAATPGPSQAGAAGTAASSRQLFQERINALLSAPMPRCLQPGANHSLLSDTRSFPDASGMEGTQPPASPSSDSGTRRPPRSAAQASHDWHGDGPAAMHSTPRGRAARSPRVPIYEHLLQQGRLRQEHHEQLRLEAVERELGELRPAPRITPDSSAPTRRLPPPGQRIEDRLLERAKAKAEQLAQEAELRRVREEEAVAAVATFRPRISAHARATKPRYSEPSADRAAWRARRLEELAQLGHALEDAQELQDRPVINRRSARLAAERRAREGLADVPVAESLLLGEHRRRLAQWQAAEAEREARERATPAITHHAALMHRAGDVGSRLHAAGYDAAIRRLQREVAWREAHTPFQPEVTPLAAVTAPRYQRGVPAAEEAAGSVPAGAPARRTVASSRGSSASRESFAPAINPVSAAIAQRLPETPMERLCRPAGVHTLSSYHADPAATLSTPRPHRWEGQEERVTAAPAVAAAAPLSASPSSPPPLPRAVAASLDAYERRRQARLAALRAEQAEAEMAECTFAPQLTAAAEALHDRQSARRGPAAVAQRAEAWHQQRERHLETMRQWQAERAEAAEERQRGHAVSVPQPSSVAASESVYGGDGRAWGVDAHLARQELARARREPHTDRHRQESARAESRADAAPTEASLRAYYRRSDAEIRSLRPPVSASSAVASALFSSALSDV